MAGLSPALLDAVDARIRAERGGKQPVAPQRTDYVTTPKLATSFSSFFPVPHENPAQDVPILDQINARIKARQDAAGMQLDAKRKALAAPIPDHWLAPPKQPVGDLVTQGERWGDSIRQPEWWVNFSAWPYLERYRFGAPPYVEMMTNDPLYREIRRTALLTQYRTALREAAARANHGDEGHARLKLQHADIYKRRLEALDRGDYAQS